ncbi:MAG: T9SS type A sorting domain-containing protein, partial [Saprospiraceae bacterium]|nr:T9SS type A sorting domain-containing protein [Saprospiraceae bacterium]
VLTATWFSMSEQNFTNDDVLFSLVVKSRRSAQLDKALAINSNFAEPKIVGSESGSRDLTLAFRNLQLQDATILFQNSPNPFVDQTIIGFYLPDSGEGTLQIRDASGRAIWSHSAIYDHGYHEYQIDADQLGTSGLLFYTLKQGDNQITKKMMQIR